MRARWVGWALAAFLAACGTPEPRTVKVAPALAPPPAGAEALSQEEVLDLSRRARDPEDAIKRIDARPLAFPLDEAHLSALGAEGIDPDVLDYLKRRSQVDWEALRGDIPDAEEQ